MANSRKKVTQHAIERWAERAAGLSVEIKAARRLCGGRSARTKDVLAKLEELVDGFSSRGVADRILRMGGDAAIKSGATRVMVDGMTFVISDGRIVTAIKGHAGGHRY